MLQFVRIKEYRLIVVLFRSVYLFRYILCYKVGFKRIFQCLMNNGVVVYYRKFCLRKVS